MGKYKITLKEFILIATFFLLAILFTNPFWLRLLAKLNPIFGFLIYYTIVITSLFIMSYFGLIVFGVKIKHPLQVIGSGMILFAFFVIFDWSSNFLNKIKNGMNYARRT